MKILDDLSEKVSTLMALDNARCVQEEIARGIDDLCSISRYQFIGLKLDYRNTWHRGRLLEPGEPIKQFKRAHLSSHSSDGVPPVQLS